MFKFVKMWNSAYKLHSTVTLVSSEKLRSVASSFFGTVGSVGGWNLSYHVPGSGAVCLLLVREQDTTVILSMV